MKKLITNHIFTYRIIYSIMAVLSIIINVFYFLPYSLLVPVFMGLTSLFFLFIEKRENLLLNNLLDGYHKVVYLLVFSSLMLLARTFTDSIFFIFLFMLSILLSVIQLSLFTYNLLIIVNLRIERSKFIIDMALILFVLSYCFYKMMYALNAFESIDATKVFLIITNIFVLFAMFMLIGILSTVKYTVFDRSILFTLFADLFIILSDFCIILYLLQGEIFFNRLSTSLLLIGTMLMLKFYEGGFEGLKIEEDETVRLASKHLYAYVNLGLNFKFSFIAILPLALAIIGVIGIRNLVYLLIIIVLHMNISYFFQSRSLAYDNLSNEALVSESLKKIIDAKTLELREVNRQLEKISITDQLTRLPNRTAFYDYLNEMLEGENEKFYLLYLDLNKFKLINDAYGHDKGDYVLHTIAERLSGLQDESTRSFRVGGDEFTIVCEHMSEEDMSEFCKKIIASIEKAIFYNGLIFYLGTSIGVAIYGEEGIDNIDDLIKAADIAMYQSKYKGSSNKYTYFKREYAKVIEEQTEILQKLEQLDFDSSFRLHYQVIMDPYLEEVVKVEGLLRWQDGDDMIPPGIFIPIAEKNDVIEDITRWVFQRAIRDMKMLNTFYDVEFIVSLNVSPKNIIDPDFMDFLKGLESRYDFDVSNVEIELTENSSVLSLAHIRSRLMQIKTMGYRVAIDDFGTGYSSLQYLKEFSVDTLKIAKELIDNLTNSKDDEKMVSSLLVLSKALSLKTVIEGVESKEQLDILKAMGCDYIQGYYYAKPMPLDELIDEYIVKGGHGGTSNI